MAASFITIILFFVYIWGLGFTVTYFLTKKDDLSERLLMQIGIGLGIFVIFSIFLNFLHIPLDWRIFFILSLLFPLYVLTQRIRKGALKIPPFNFALKKSTFSLLAVLVIFLISFYVYSTGAFSYPYLEDEDPWDHAVGVKYVAIEKNAYDPPVTVPGYVVDPVLSYIDPYPPGYNILLGILHQTSADLTWTLKFFNALIISLGFIFFFFFAKRFMNSHTKALFATFVLASIPSYLSHFIWAHSLVITLVFPTFYAFERIKDDKRWTVVAGLLVAAIWVTQNFSQPIKISTMILLYLIVGSILTRKFFKYDFAALGGGIALSFLWWGIMIKKYGLRNFIGYYTHETITDTGQVVTSAVADWSIFSKLGSVLSALTSSGGSASRAYTFNDFFVAKSQNMINNPIGVGVVLSLLTLVGILYILWRYKSEIVTSKNTWLCISLFWMIFTFWGVNGMTFPISVARGPFRVWMLMAIPIALIATEGLSFFMTFFRKQKVVKILVVFVVILGIFFTSTQQKIDVNTSIWPTSGSYTNNQEPFQYAEWFNSIPANTNVFLYSPRDKLTIGFGKSSCLWCQDVIDFRYDILNKDADQLHSFLKSKDYEYLVINSYMDFRYLSGVFGENKTQAELPKKYSEIVNSANFLPVHQVEGSFVVFKVT